MIEYACLILFFFPKEPQWERERKEIKKGQKKKYLMGVYVRVEDEIMRKRKKGEKFL